MLGAADLSQGAALLAAVACAAAALVAERPRRRAQAMIAALVVAPLVVLPQASDVVVGAPLLAAAAAGLLATGGLAVVLGRRPQLFVLLAVGALPFRTPLPTGDGTANLLLPLYVVIAAGVVAYAADHLRTAERDAAPAPAGGELPVARARSRVWLTRVLAAVLVLYGVQALYSSDPGQAAKNVGFFYVPFAILFRLLVDARWSRRLVVRCLAVATGLALVFALVGFVEYATKELLLANPGVDAANAAKPYFRVNSLFYDPNIYGRFLALTMVLLAGALLWSGRRRTAALVTAALAVLWAGLVLSLSQSSFAALLVGLAVLAGLRWGRPRRLLAAAAAALAAGAAVVALAPGALGIDPDSMRSLDRATSGRLRLMLGGVRMFADRPVIGFGSGAFAERYRRREGVGSSAVAVASHSIPLTIAAEQGIVGLSAYLALLAVAFAAVFTGLRTDLTRGPPAAAAVARAGIAAAFAALVVHTLLYAGFLEDPLMWALLAAAGALSIAPRDRADEAAGQRPAAPAQTPAVA